MILPDRAKEIIRSGALGHLVTTNRDGTGARFPPMDDPPPGVRMRIAVERAGGIGPWRTA